jgi:hypothetical protein
MALSSADILANGVWASIAGALQAPQRRSDSKPVDGEIVAGDALYQPTMATLPMVPSSSHSPDHHFLLS